MLLECEPVFSFDDHIRPLFPSHAKDLFIIGQEVPGLVLVAWTDVRSRLPSTATDPLLMKGDLDLHLVTTRIDIVDLNSLHRKTIYSHHEQILIVHASVDQDLTLLAFTKKTSSETAHADRYETFLAEIHPQHRVFSLGTPTVQAQCVQFLYQMSTRKDHQLQLYMLFILEQEFVQMYSLTVQRQRQRFSIEEQPRKEKTFIRKHLWYEFDQQTETLFCLQMMKNARSQENVLDLALTVLQFQRNGALAIPKSVASSTSTLATEGTKSSASGSPISRNTRSLSETLVKAFMPKLASASSSLSLSSSSLSGRKTELDEKSPPKSPVSVGSASVKRKAQDLFWADKELAVQLSSNEVDMIQKYYGNGNVCQAGECPCQLTVKLCQTESTDSLIFVFWYLPPTSKECRLVIHYFSKPSSAVAMVEQSTQAGRIETHFDLKTNRNVPACQVLCGLYDGQLFLFMPGERMQFFDCGSGHGAIPGFIIEDDASERLLPCAAFYGGHLQPFQCLLNALDDPLCFVHAFYNAKTNKAYRYKVRMMSLVTAKHLHALIKPCHYAYLFHFLIDHMNLDPDSAVILEMLQTFISDNSISLFKIERLLKAYLQASVQHSCSVVLDTTLQKLLPLFVGESFIGESFIGDGDPLKHTHAAFDSVVHKRSDNKNRFVINYSSWTSNPDLLPRYQLSVPQFISKTPLGRHQDGVMSLTSPWVQLLLSGSMDASSRTRLLHQRMHRQSDTGPTLRRRLDSMLTRFFNPSESGGTSLGGADEQMKQKTANDENEETRDVLSRKWIQDDLTEYLVQQLTFHSQTSLGSSVTAGPPFGKSFKSASQTQPDSQILSQANLAVKEYTQVQMMRSGQVWSWLSDALALPKLSDFERCSCQMCSFKHSLKESESQPPLSARLTSAQSAKGRISSQTSMKYSTIFNQFRHSKQHGHLLSRFQYVNHVMRATVIGSQAKKKTPQEGLAVPCEPSESRSNPDTTLRSLDVQSRLRYFQILKTLYMVLEELAYPLPVGLANRLVLLGFHCLPKHVFVQYLERGIFRMTDSFVKHALDVLSPCQNDPAWRSFTLKLLMHVRNKKKLVRLLRPMSAYRSLFVQIRLGEYCDATGWPDRPKSTLESKHHFSPRAATSEDSIPSRRLSMLEEGLSFFAEDGEENRSSKWSSSPIAVPRHPQRTSDPCLASLSPSLSVHLHRRSVSQVEMGSLSSPQSRPDMEDSGNAEELEPTGYLPLDNLIRSLQEQQQRQGQGGLLLHEATRRLRDLYLNPG